MAEKKYTSNINLDGHELKNVVVDKRSVAPTPAVEGQIYYDSEEKLLFQYDGVSWVSVDSSVHHTFIYDESGIQKGNRYNTWTDLYDRISSLDGYKTIYLNSELMVDSVGAINLDYVSFVGQNIVTLLGNPLVFGEDVTEVSSWKSGSLKNIMLTYIGFESTLDINIPEYSFFSVDNTILSGGIFILGGLCVFSMHNDSYFFNFNNNVAIKSINNSNRIVVGSGSYLMSNTLLGDANVSITVQDGKFLQAYTTEMQPNFEGNINLEAGVTAATISFSSPRVQGDSVLQAINNLAGPRKVTLDSGPTININANLGNTFTVVLNQNTTIANPTNGQDGQVLWLGLRQDSVGSRSVSFGSNFRFGTDVVEYIPSPTPDTTDWLGVIYLNNRWNIVGISRGYTD